MLADERSSARRGPVDFDRFAEEQRAALRAWFGYATLFGADPDDITQDTLIRAQHHHHRFASHDELSAWCKVVGRNLIRAHARTTRRARETSHPNPLAVVRDAELHDPETVAVENAELGRVLASLRPRHAEVLLLDAKGLTYEEIAAKFGSTTAAVGMLLQRARKAARDAWGQIVAAFVWITVRGRRLFDPGTAAVSPQAVMLVSMSMVVALSSHPGANANANGATGAGVSPEQRWFVGPIATAAEPTPAVVRDVRTPPKSLTTAPVTISGEKQPRKMRRLPAAVPPLPGACAPGACVGSCPEEENVRGDRLYVKPVGDPCDLNVTQSIVPACEVVPENPAAGCERREPDDWTINPPPIPEGEHP